MAKPSSALPRIRDVEAVIFDLDGVLVDSEPVHFRAANRILAKYGKAISEAEYRRFIGWGETATWVAWKELYALPASVNELAVQIRAASLHEIAIDLPIIAPAVDLARQLRADGMPLALASSSPHDRIDAELHVAGLQDIFAVRVSGEDPEIKHPKPAPDVYLHAAALLGARPESCLAIEDSATGALAAHRAGMTVVAVPTAMTADQDFGVADVVIESLRYFRLLVL